MTTLLFSRADVLAQQRFSSLLLLLFAANIVLGSASTERNEASETGAGLSANEQEAKAFLANYDEEYSKLITQVNRASWNYETNLTDHNAKLLEELSAKMDAYSSAAYLNASKFNASSFSYATQRLLKAVGSPGLSPEEMKELSQIENQMARLYSSYQVCRDNATCLSLDPDITSLMSTSRNASERLFVWRNWHDGVGRALRPLYARYVDLKNRLAKLKGYTDCGDQWRRAYEIDDLDAVVRDLYQEIEPLYRHLHAYVRRKLFNVYGPKVIDLKGPLPAHLVGDIWGRFWSGLYDTVQPYPQKASLEPTETMVRQNYTVRRMFDMGNEFFVSMGMKPVPDAFYELSMLEKPSEPNRQAVCHPTAWDFGDGKDFRIKMCAQVNFDDFLTVHHELGHTQYQMQYAHLPLGYRDGANDGFHEAIGELMSMSVSTKKHLHAVGLLHHIDADRETDINFLMSQALRTVTTLPFHLVQDAWRWKIFGGLPTEQWNSEFWKQKREIVGVAPAVARNNLRDLDGAAIYHVATGYDMIRYFTRTVMQYQFAEALCNASGHAGPLYECDFYNSTRAGDLLARMLSMGSSRPWPEAMEALTGQRRMSAQPLLNYFKPLSDWLEEENARNKEHIGWDSPATGSSTAPSLSPHSFSLTVALLVLSRLAL